MQLTAQRSVRDAEQIEKEEESRRQLEKKAEMYEKLQRDDSEDDRFLVDFGRQACPKRSLKVSRTNFGACWDSSLGPYILNIHSGVD